MARKPKPPNITTGGALPDRDQILEFLSSTPGKAGKREIARAFGIKGGARIALKRVLAEMTADGALSGNKKSLKEKGGLPPVATLEVTARDSDGDLLAKPVDWDENDGKRPLIRLLAVKPGEAPPGIGDRVLAKIHRIPGGSTAQFEASMIKKLPREKRRLLGIFRASKRGGGSIEPIDRRELKSWPLAPDDCGKAEDGDLVRFDLIRRGRLASPRATVLESLGNPRDQRQISLIAIHAHGIPEDFPESVIAESKALQPPSLSARLDLRDVPLITIDPSDARDHDDAVYAEPDSSSKNSGGWIVTVAIADVAHFVRPGSKLDTEAQVRGNSVYFPDRVVPMLPELISNELCSLKEGEDRACLTVRMTFNKNGVKTSHTFHRAMMRSAAKLSYQEAQAAIDGIVSAKCAPLIEPVLKPLWAAFEVLTNARNSRSPLDLDLPERKIVLDVQGQVAKIITPERLDAHRLIEEFMIQANVSAAETLEEKRTPLVYRVHDAPSPEKLKGLRDFLETLDMKIPHAGALRPEAFNKILADAKTLPLPDLINEVILRSQSQAEYAPKNIGHFGLNLVRYAHFTSPIRRYADLVVHRALIRALGLGEDGLTESEIENLSQTAKTISETERRAMSAERETADRLIAAHLADRIGATFEARISGVTRSGLFVRLKETGADGFIPISSLGSDYFHHIEAAHALSGARTGETYTLGDPVQVRLLECIPTAGALRFEMLTQGKKSDAGQKSFKGHRGMAKHRRSFGPNRTRGGR